MSSPDTFHRPIFNSGELSGHAPLSNIQLSISSPNIIPSPIFNSGELSGHSSLSNIQLQMSSWETLRNSIFNSYIVLYIIYISYELTQRPRESNTQLLL